MTWFALLLGSPAFGGGPSITQVAESVRGLSTDERAEASAALQSLTVNDPYTRAAMQIPLALHHAVHGIDAKTLDPRAQKEWRALQAGLETHVAVLDALEVRLPEPGSSDALDGWDDRMHTRRELAQRRQALRAARHLAGAQHLPPGVLQGLLLRHAIGDVAQEGHHVAPAVGAVGRGRERRPEGLAAHAPHADLLEQGPPIAPQAVVQAHRGRLQHVVWSDDGTMVATAGFTANEVRVWSPGGELLQTFGQVRRPVELAFAPDGAQLAVATEDGRLGLWDVHTGMGLGSFGGPIGRIVAVRYDADGGTVRTMADDGWARAIPATVDAQVARACWMLRASGRSVAPCLSGSRLP